MAVFEYLDHFLLAVKNCNNTESDYIEGRPLIKNGRARSLRPLDEFFIVMRRLRQGFLEDHLAQLFKVSASTVCTIFITWVNFMFFKFGQMNIWPIRKVMNAMPKSSKGRYKSTRVIMTVLRLDVKRQAACSWIKNFSVLTKITQLWKVWLVFLLVEQWNSEVYCKWVLSTIGKLSEGVDF